MKVYILVRHNGIDDVFGSIAVFKTLRVGFPTAEIVTYVQGDFDHELIPENAIKIGRVEHYNWIETVMDLADEEELVFCDTDMIFYESVEEALSSCPSLMCGRHIPDYYNITINAIEVERLHTHLLYIKNPMEMKTWIKKTLNTGLHPYNPYAPFQYYYHGQLRFYDTMANLTQSYGQARGFTSELLDKYTHLVSGTMLKGVANLLPGGERLIQHHQMAKENPESVRGLWREHDKFYQHYAIK
jgi:hypothetical protein